MIRPLLAIALVLLLTGVAWASDLGKVSLRLAVYAPPEGPVRMVLRVENLGGARVVIAQPNAQSYDFAIVSEGVEVWRWSAGKYFIEQVGELTIDPGQTLVFSEEWSRHDFKGHPVETGRYTARAWVPVLNSEPLEAEPRSLVVQAPR